MIGSSSGSWQSRQIAQPLVGVPLAHLVFGDDRLRCRSASSPRRADRRAAGPALHLAAGQDVIDGRNILRPVADQELALEGQRPVNDLPRGLIVRSGRPTAGDGRTCIPGRRRSASGSRRRWAGRPDRPSPCRCSRPASPASPRSPTSRCSRRAANKRPARRQAARAGSQARKRAIMRIIQIAGLLRGRSRRGEPAASMRPAKCSEQIYPTNSATSQKSGNLGRSG